MKPFGFVLLGTLIGSWVLLVKASEAYRCSLSKPCAKGCCSQYGYCGHTIAYCGQGCINGPCYDSFKNQNKKTTTIAASHHIIGCSNENPCPSSQCCSKDGTCGINNNHCGLGCQSGPCFQFVPNSSKVEQRKPAPELINPGCTNALGRRIGYWGSWSISRECDAFQVSDINPFLYTDLIYSFASVSEDHRLVLSQENQASQLKAFSELKIKNPALRLYIAVGGWAFNDPPTEKRFSNMVSTPANRATFIQSSINLMRTFKLDGLDIDWEYPGFRGGNPNDKPNLAFLMGELHEAFDQTPERFQLTIAVPAGAYSLEYFDMSSISKNVNMVHLMSYDYNGLSHPEKEVHSHVSLEDIRSSVNLMLNMGVTADKLALGVAAYGRSFKLKDPDCPHPKCKFEGQPTAGKCTNEVYTAPGNSYKYLVYNKNQWVGYDDATTMREKIKYASLKCLGGMFVWAVDTDFQANLIEQALYGPILPTKVSNDDSSKEKNYASSSMAEQTTPSTEAKIPLEILDIESSAVSNLAESKMLLDLASNESERFVAGNIDLSEPIVSIFDDSLFQSNTIRTHTSDAITSTTSSTVSVQLLVETHSVMPVDPVDANLIELSSSTDSGYPYISNNVSTFSIDGIIPPTPVSAFFSMVSDQVLEGTNPVMPFISEFSSTPYSIEVSNEHPSSTLKLVEEQTSISSSSTDMIEDALLPENSGNYTAFSGFEEILVGANISLENQSSINDPDTSRIKYDTLIQLQSSVSHHFPEKTPAVDNDYLDWTEDLQHQDKPTQDSNLNLPKIESIVEDEIPSYITSQTFSEDPTMLQTPAPDMMKIDSMCKEGDSSVCHQGGKVRGKSNISPTNNKYRPGNLDPTIHIKAISESQSMLLNSSQSPRTKQSRRIKCMRRIKTKSIVYEKVKSRRIKCRRH